MKYFNRLAMGTCYYPEHWDESLWLNDLQRMLKAGIGTIRIAEFAWNKFENEEGVFTFDFFDRFLDVVEQTDMKVIFCTPTATPPAWLTQKYPEVLQADQDGHIFYHGCRRHYNYNAPVYLEKTRIIVEELAQHYANRRCIVGWQIDNELNCQIGEFFSEADSVAFRVFLKEKYGTLNKLNEAWGTVFWNQTYTDWSQIYLPRHTPHNTSNPHLKLDSLRFYSESCISYCKLHYDILKKHLPKNVFVTTQGLFPHVNYNRLHDEALDFLTYDSYPMFGLSDEGGNRLKDRKWSMQLARIRGVGNEFGIMEQQSGPGGWYNRQLMPTPKPGQIRLWTYQSVANGADYISYFRWRTCTFGTEIYWHGILNYDNQDNRRLQEITDIGREFEKLSDLAGKTYQAKVAILYDYDNEWDGETDVWHGPLRKYSNAGLFQALQESHVPFNYVTVSPNLRAADLKAYEVVFAPHMTIMDPDLAECMKEYVKGGGILIAGARTGYKDRNGRCPMDIMPIGMTDLFGMEIRDFTALNAESPYAYASLGDKKLYMPVFHDLLTPVADTCETVAVYSEDFYKGTPAIVKNQYGKGQAWYFGAAFDCETVKELLKALGVESLIKDLAEVPPCCEISIREGDGQAYLFVLNYTGDTVELELKKEMRNALTDEKESGAYKLDAYGVLILEV